MNISALRASIVFSGSVTPDLTVPAISYRRASRPIPPHNFRIICLLTARLRLIGKRYNGSLGPVLLQKFIHLCAHPFFKLTLSLRGRSRATPLQ